MNAIIANSKPVGIEMQERWPKRPVRVVPFLTADERVREPLPRAPIGDRQIRVAYLGRLAIHKRIERLIHEWPRLCAHPPLGPARLDVYGDDLLSEKTLPRLRSFIESNGLQHSIHCHGGYNHSAVADIMARTDIVVLPSEFEGLPLVLVEAMQHGVPIVATNVGGTAELAEENPDVLITSADWDAFLRGLSQMAHKLRAGEINSLRLHRWAETRYGYDVVMPLWRSALMDTRSFFGLQ
jgi:glycosyltransferase involved in cell wall biosynthesis